MLSLVNQLPSSFTPQAPSITEGLGGVIDRRKKIVEKYKITDYKFTLAHATHDISIVAWNIKEELMKQLNELKFLISQRLKKEDVSRVSFLVDYLNNHNIATEFNYGHGIHRIQGYIVQTEYNELVFCLDRHTLDTDESILRVITPTSLELEGCFNIKTQALLEFVTEELPKVIQDVSKLPIWNGG